MAPAGKSIIATKLAEAMKKDAARTSTIFTVGAIASLLVGTMYGYSYLKGDVESRLPTYGKQAYYMGFMGQYCAFIPGLIMDKFGPGVTIMYGAIMCLLGFSLVGNAISQGSGASALGCIPAGYALWIGIAMAGQGSKSMGFGTMLGAANTFPADKTATISGIYLAFDAFSAIVALELFRNLFADTGCMSQFLYNSGTDKTQEWPALANFFTFLAILIGGIGVVSSLLFFNIYKAPNADGTPYVPAIEDEDCTEEESEALKAEKQESANVKSEEKKEEKKPAAKPTNWTFVFLGFAMLMLGTSQGLALNGNLGHAFEHSQAKRQDNYSINSIFRWVHPAGENEFHAKKGDSVVLVKQAPNADSALHKLLNMERQQVVGGSKDGDAEILYQFKGETICTMTPATVKVTPYKYFGKTAEAPFVFATEAQKSLKENINEYVREYPSLAATKADKEAAFNMKTLNLKSKDMKEIMNMRPQLLSIEEGNVSVKSELFFLASGANVRFNFECPAFKDVDSWEALGLDGKMGEKTGNSIVLVNEGMVLDHSGVRQHSRTLGKVNKALGKDCPALQKQEAEQKVWETVTDMTVTCKESKAEAAPGIFLRMLGASQEYVETFTTSTSFSDAETMANFRHPNGEALDGDEDILHDRNTSKLHKEDRKSVTLVYAFTIGNFIGRCATGFASDAMQKVSVYTQKSFWYVLFLTCNTLLFGYLWTADFDYAENLNRTSLFGLIGGTLYGGMFTISAAFYKQIVAHKDGPSFWYGLALVLLAVSSKIFGMDSTGIKLAKTVETENHHAEMVSGNNHYNNFMAVGCFFNVIALVIAVIVWLQQAQETAAEWKKQSGSKKEADFNDSDTDSDSDSSVSSDDEGHKSK